MKRITGIMILVLFASLGQAQTLHTPNEVVKLVDESTVSYHLLPVEKWEFVERDYSVNDYFTHQTLEDGEISITRYELEPYGKRAFQLAEEAMAQDDMSAARENYKLILVKQPDYAPALTCIGLTYFRQGDIDPAIRYFKEAIEKNFFDFMAHWSLAMCHFEQKAKEKAAAAIAIAWVLNRNEPRLAKDAQRMFKAIGNKMKDWNFDPECSIQRLDKEVRIRFTEEWLAYALVRALWKFEPGYAETMGGPPEFNNTQDREALFNLVLTNSNNKAKVTSKNHAIKKLWEAMEQKYLIEYIIFEIWLREEPAIAFAQPRSAIERLAKYVLTR